jgi:hypothetical protein
VEEAEDKGTQAAGRLARLRCSFKVTHISARRFFLCSQVTRDRLSSESELRGGRSGQSTPTPE